MKYIKRSSNGIIISDSINYELEFGLKEYINSLCMNNLSTFKGREEAAGHLLNRKSILPIYVDEGILLVPTESIRNYECTYINYHKVLHVEFDGKKQTKVIFDDLTDLSIPISKEKMMNQILRSRYILERKTAY